MHLPESESTTTGQAISTDQCSKKAEKKSRQQLGSSLSFSHVEIRLSF